MLSALQHYLFCPRQCALIHVEGLWSENYLTALGRAMHTHVDQKVRETRRDVHLATSLRLISNRFGVMGVADMVEFYKSDCLKNAEGQIVGAVLPGRKGFWQPFPIEYKRGAPKAHRADEVQLCAQALCLEEMLGVVILNGALFYGETKRRMEVMFDDELRNLTESVIQRVHQLVEQGATPLPVYSKGCKACSLYNLCRPEDISERDSARRWINNQLGVFGI
jgi:CRISPR-associated exonuclease Cas4